MSVKQLIDYGYLPSGVLALDDRTTFIANAIKLFRLNMGAPDGMSDEEVFNIPRCGCPDFDTTGSGSWPKGCDPDNLNVHSALYFVDKSNMPSYLNDTFEDSWELMRKAYANIGFKVRRSNSRSNYNSIVTFQPGSGWIGLAIVGRGQTCRTRMWAKFDNRYGSTFDKMRRIYQWAFLIAHEIGHNCGMSHTRGGIMNASLINGIFYEDQWRRNDPAFSILKRYYDGNPIIEDAPIWSIPSPEQPRE